MPQLKNYKVFISHCWGYGDDYETIINWMKDANNFEFANYSVTSEKHYPRLTERELKARIELRIVRSTCVIVFLSMYSGYSDWINWEIETAHGRGIPVIGIRPRGQEKVPVEIETLCDTVVGWQQRSVIDAIRVYSL